MEFAQVERSAWTSAPVVVAYAAAFPSITSGAAPALLQAVGAQRGERLLDVACGPGTVARLAAEQGLRPVLCDLSRPMLRSAAASGVREPCVEGLADRLPFARGRFDRVVSNFGLLHFPEPLRAIAEAARVTRPGGAVGFTVWATDAVAFQAIPEAVRTLGLALEEPRAPAYFAFARAELFREALEQAGLVHPRVFTTRWLARVSSADRLFDAFRDGTARTRALLAALREEQRARVRAEVQRRLEPYRTPAGLELPTSAVVGTAQVAPA